MTDDQAVFWNLGKTVMNGVRLAKDRTAYEMLAADRTQALAVVLEGWGG